MKLLERGLFTGVPALIYLNLMKNSLETITYNNILPLMDNLVNNTNSILDITGALNIMVIYKMRVIGIYDFRFSRQRNIWLMVLAISTITI